MFRSSRASGNRCFLLENITLLTFGSVFIVINTHYIPPRNTDIQLRNDMIMSVEALIPSLFKFK